ncbi:MAG: zinc ribbon domain-containing protein [Deltaproteobacteria bacterium]|jgi:putative FmdB family regulatory protein|nr:zinc ribbon domain-containing protein [Deltaproteobacteria bacterium]
MPIYEYECQNCHHVTETIQKFSDPPLTVCPECGGPISKLMSMNSFVLKGGGWYATDYAKSLPAAPDAKKPAEGAGSKGPAETPASGTDAKKTQEVKSPAKA